VTGVVIRETVPDTFLRQADQVVNLDLAVEDLTDRLQSGKIYDKDKIPWALEHFFKEENLLRLRELALREVAESVDRSSLTQHDAGDQAHRGVGGRVMVCIASSSPRAAILLRRGSRLAGRLNTSWFVAYVETPGEAPHQIDAEAQRLLLTNIEKARELGAEVVRLQSRDPVAALVDFARSHGVGYIMIGRAHQPWWRRLVGRSTMDRFVEEADGFDLYIVSFDEEKPAP
jgi:two-component system sensor histidine kinase KdpD